MWGWCACGTEGQIDKEAFGIGLNVIGPKLDHVSYVRGMLIKRHFRHQFGCGRFAYLLPVSFLSAAMKGSVSCWAVPAIVVRCLAAPLTTGRTGRTRGRTGRIGSPLSPNELRPEDLVVESVALCADSSKWW